MNATPKKTRPRAPGARVSPRILMKRFKGGKVVPRTARARRSPFIRVRLADYDSPVGVSPESFNRMKHYLKMNTSEVVNYALARFRDEIVVRAFADRRALGSNTEILEGAGKLRRYARTVAALRIAASRPQTDCFRWGAIADYEVVVASRRVLARLSAEKVLGATTHHRRSMSGKSALESLTGWFEASIRLTLTEAETFARILSRSRWITRRGHRHPPSQRKASLASRLDRWEREGRLFALTHMGTKYYPAYGLSFSTRKGRRRILPVKAMAKVIRIFTDKTGGWALAGWFSSPNSRLDDRAPKDLLATEPDAVIAAARDSTGGFHD